MDTKATGALIARRRKELAERERTENWTHYTSSVNPNEEGDVAEATVKYFEEQGMNTRFNPKSLHVRETVFLGDYMAVLLSDREGEWCMSFWQKDEVYPERFRIAGGRSRIEPGAWGLLEWNFGTREQPVLVASGVALPEEARFYEYGGDQYRLRSWVNTDLGTALDIFIMALPMDQAQPSAIPLALYDESGAYVPRGPK